MVSQKTQELSDMYTYQVRAGNKARKRWPDKSEVEIKAYEAGIITGWQAAKAHSLTTKF